MRSHITCVWIDIIETKEKVKGVGKDDGFHVKQYGQFWKKIKYLPVQISGIYPKDIKSVCEKDICIPQSQ